VLIFGAVLGKSWREMAELLAQYAAAAVVSTPGSFKKSDPAALHRICLEAGIDASLKPEPAEALAEARRIASVSQPVVVTGSFYMVAEIRALIARTEGLPGAPADATQGAGSSG
jgi:dihydrofolate synthase/folylpolyglutamate synthase